MEWADKDTGLMLSSNKLTDVSIRQITDSQLPFVEQLFYNYPYKDFQLKQLGIPKRTMAAILKDSLQGEKVFNCAFWEEEHMTGMLSARYLPWISTQFSANMYSLKHMLSDNKDSDFYYTMLSYITGQIDEMDFLDCRVANGDIDAIQALESFGFRFAGNEVYMVNSLVNSSHLQTGKIEGIEKCSSLHRDKVVELARRTHVHNRYMYDPYVDRNEAIELYSKYMAGFAFGPDYRSIVKVEGGKLLGFLFYKYNRNLSEKVGGSYASLDFIGVDTDAQNQGIGEQLNRAALADLASTGTTRVVVRTFGNNYPAIRICQKVGFQITASDLHFHLWLRPKGKLNTSVDSAPVLSLRSLA
jgi:ribosomal protein S18 acetylase RimI-like enzyme